MVVLNLERQQFQWVRRSVSPDAFSRRELSAPGSCRGSS